MGRIHKMVHVYTDEGAHVGGFVDAETAEEWIDSRHYPAGFQIGNIYRPDAIKAQGVYLPAGDKRLDKADSHGFLADEAPVIDLRTDDERALDNAMEEAS